MGVHGLWNLIEPSGKIVPLETLENKVLAVDVSIWLHQVVKGFQDTRGNPLPNAHLLGLFHRICKLLFYKIKPVFVFDGGVPHLKKQTVAARQQKKNKAETDAERLRERILTNLIKHKAVNNALGNSDLSNAARIQKHNDQDEMFRLPELSENKEEEENRSEAEDSVTSEEDESPSKRVPRDLHSVDVSSAQFKALPADVRHEILTDLRETRKQSSWGRLHEMPKESGDFSSFQMSRLLKRRSVQVSLEQAEKEMGGHTLSLREMEEMLKEQGVNTSLNVGSRIASDNVTRFIYIKDSGNDAGNNEKLTGEGSSKTVPTVESASDQHSKSDESDNDIRTVTENNVVYESNWVSDDEFDHDMSDDDETMRLAKNFMFENSGLTQKQILKIIQDQIRKKKANKSLDYTNPQPTTSKSIPPEDKLLHCEGTSVNSNNSNPREAENKLIDCTTMKLSETSDKTVPVTDELQLNDMDSLLKTEHENGYENVTCETEINRTINKHTDTQDTSVEKETRNRAVSQLVCSDASEKSPEAITIKETKLNEESIVEVQSSDSEVDFVEVNSNTNSAQNVSDMKAKTLLEVVIKKDDCNLDDDIFADIFTKSPDVTEEKHNSAPTSNVSDAGNKNLLHVEDNENRNDLSFSLPQKIDAKNENVVVTSKECNINDVTTVDISSSHNTGHIAEVPYADDVAASETFEHSAVKHSLKVTHEDGQEDFQTIKELQTQEKVQEDAVTTEKKLQTMKNLLEEEQRLLFTERGRQERLASSITEQMNLEAQELLQLFGVPYVIAPMEAEAQCAFLDAVSLTDGTITDDSDIWLFGGQNVYKNFFNQKKHVLQFKAAEIQRYFRLTRRQLIVLALLVGSDYTTGLSGIGPVTALEIISAFPCGNEDSVEAITRGLRKFREWLITGKAAGPGGRSALRHKLRDIKLSEGFPNTAVVEAYVFPEIDHSKETFTWSTPDVSALRNFAREKFGWTQMRTDEILLPVLKRLGERNVQKTIENYFKSKPIFRPVEGKLSKRVQKAVDRIDRGETSSETEEEPRPKRKQTSEKSARVNNKKKKAVKEATTVTEQPRISSEGAQAVEESVKIIANQKSACVRRVRKTNVHPYKQSGEFILQREKAKIDSLKTKLKAIEIYRMSKIENKKKSARSKPKELKEANLSESSSDE
ncbi:DNA excision repair protein ERCC-5 homolog [Schistocerca piceifrons]|uniref:DNA excision repair protein ERCC-5 homolog n=1 Tax=Schistocerca piceifrons TaxID=274613 RepID=UPI001F5F6464|nr:DNA excision repair protein ERCC-5 homolog [Schistocerca piceifrons]XP_047109337.1 DNA excision repair protein ERCC-5 homolog [Schistocerca piceifrons]XP_047109339.1 DNA excision repair protein ERCC-5 homolog [Schistocerca piceifrons]